MLCATDELWNTISETNDVFWLIELKKKKYILETDLVYSIQPKQKFHEIYLFLLSVWYSDIFSKY